MIVLTIIVLLSLIALSFVAWFILTKNKFMKISIVLLFAISVTLFCVFRTNSIFLNFVFPPNDLYKDLIKMDISVSEVGKYKIEFKNKYPGDHSISLLLENPVPISKSAKKPIKWTML
jgi:amino acid transporter